MNETAEQGPVTTAAGEQQEARTFTRDEVNSIVADCLNRERAKYADYDALKEKAGQYDATKAELDALNKATARSEMLNRVSSATGVPAELLTGETEEDCTAQAQAIAKFAKPKYPDVRDGGEPYKAYRVSMDDLSPAFRRDLKHTPKKYPNFYF